MNRGMSNTRTPAAAVRRAAPVAVSIRAALLAMLPIVGLALSPPAQCADDPYLSAINAEGKRLEFLGKARQEHEALQRLEAAERKQGKPSAPVTTNTGVGASAPAANSREFEDALRIYFPGSHALYELMDSNEKQQVFTEYRKRNVEGTGRFIPVIARIISITNAKRAQKQ